MHRYFKNIYYFWELLDWILLLLYEIQEFEIDTFGSGNTPLNNVLGAGGIK